jgi:hypothetical protein
MEHLFSPLDWKDYLLEKKLNSIFFKKIKEIA